LKEKKDKTVKSSPVLRAENIMQIKCTTCQNDILEKDNDNIDDLLEFPNKNNSFMNAFDDNTADQNVIIKKLYSNDELSAKYNYLFNKLL
jgi:hypothetical protein